MHIVRGNNPLWWNTCHSPNPTLKESCNFRWWLQEELSILFERIASCLIHPEEEETGRCGPWRQHAQSARSMHTHMNSLWVKRTSGKLPKIKSLYCILPKHAVCQVKGSRIKGWLGCPGMNRMEQRLGLSQSWGNWGIGRIQGGCGCTISLVPSSCLSTEARACESGAIGSFQRQNDPLPTLGPPPAGVRIGYKVRVCELNSIIKAVWIWALFKCYWGTIRKDFIEEIKGSDLKTITDMTTCHVTTPWDWLFNQMDSIIHLKNIFLWLFSDWDEAEGKDSSTFFKLQKQYMLPVKIYVHHKNL